MKIFVDCDCGESLKTCIDDSYDVTSHGECSLHDEVQCPSCLSKYRITLSLDILPTVDNK